MYKIRAATAKDASAIAAVGRHTFSTTFGHTVEPHQLQAFLDESYSTEAIAKDLADKNRDTFVGVDIDGKVQGFTMLTRGSHEPCVEHIPDRVELQRIYVDPSAHGKGLGPALARIVDDTAREQGFRNIWLGVWEENHPALKAYTKWGYKQVGTHDFVVGGVVQKDLVMAKSLYP